VEITEARVKLMPSRTDRLQAFCTVTIDNDFVIRDIKIIEGSKGAFVAMPSRKLSDKCPKCGGKNHLRARYCNDCGGHLDENRASKDKRGRAKLHADIAHPINSVCRERIQKAILEAYEQEVAHSKEPGYVPPKLYDEEEVEDLEEFMHPEEERTRETHREEHEPPEEEPEKTPKKDDDFAAGIL
jgi:stage V sporulation protein G